MQRKIPRGGTFSPAMALSQLQFWGMRIKRTVRTMGAYMMPGKTLRVRASFGYGGKKVEFSQDPERVLR